MSSAGEIFKDFLSTVQARMTSPLLGSFLVFWPIINWRLIMVLVEPKSASEIFFYVDNILYAESAFPGFFYHYIFPLLLSFLYLWAYPIIDAYISRIRIWASNFKTQIILEAEGRSVIDREFQVDFLKKHESRVQDLRDMLQKANEHYSRSHDRNQTVVRILQSSLQKQILTKYAYEVGLDASQAKTLCNFFLEEEGKKGRIPLYDKLFSHEHFDAIILLIQELKTSQMLPSGRYAVRMGHVSATLSDVHHEEVERILDYAYAFNVIEHPCFSADSLYYSTPAISFEANASVLLRLKDAKNASSLPSAVSAGPA